MPDLAADAAQPTRDDGMSYGRAADLAPVRAFVRTRALALGLPAARVDLLTVAVSELASNTLQHTTGGGRVRVWAEGGQVILAVADGGPPRSFGEMPPADSPRGRGLAIVNSIADEVSSATGPDGTVVQVRMNL